VKRTAGWGWVTQEDSGWGYSSRTSVQLDMSLCGCAVAGHMRHLLPYSVAGQMPTVGAPADSDIHGSCWAYIEGLWAVMQLDCTVHDTEPASIAVVAVVAFGLLFVSVDWEAQDWVPCSYVPSYLSVVATLFQPLHFQHWPSQSQSDLEAVRPLIVDCLQMSQHSFANFLQSPSYRCRSFELSTTLV
jgi:hypothetical protein